MLLAFSGILRGNIDGTASDFNFGLFGSQAQDRAFFRSSLVHRIKIHIEGSLTSEALNYACWPPFS